MNQLAPQLNKEMNTAGALLACYEMLPGVDSGSLSAQVFLPFDWKHPLIGQDGSSWGPWDHLNHGSVKPLETMTSSAQPQPSSVRSACKDHPQGWPFVGSQPNTECWIGPLKESEGEGETMGEGQCFSATHNPLDPPWHQGNEFSLKVRQLQLLIIF